MDTKYISTNSPIYNVERSTDNDLVKAQADQMCNASKGAQFSNNNKKCHQLRHFICNFNREAMKIFHLAPNASFDKLGVPLYGKFYPGRQYNKDNPDKFCQGKNKEQIDTDPTIRKLPTTQKDVANAILKSDIANDPNG
eukprot:4319004-Ditylum_brightwellii.AAC.2